MKKILLVIFAIAPLFINAQTPIYGGSVSGTWDLAGSPYMVYDEITVEETETLTIEPGVEVRFLGWTKFIVDGTLIAVGTDTNRILFTANDTSQYRWHGIRIIDNDNTITLDYCIIEHGLTDLSQGTYPENAGGGIIIFNCLNATITISNTEFRYNQALFGGGLECDNANATIDHCTFTYNTAMDRGGGIQLYGNCNPVVTNSTFTYNHAEKDGGAATCDLNCSCEFIGNTFIHNTSETHGGAIDAANAAGFVAKGNLVAHNVSDWGGGFSFIGFQGIELSNNTITCNFANSWGGGIISG